MTKKGDTKCNDCYLTRMVATGHPYRYLNKFENDAKRVNESGNTVAAKG